MRKRARLFLWGIILLTVVAILIDLPSFPLPKLTLTLPLLNRHIKLPSTYPGITLQNRKLLFKEGLDLQGGTSVTLKANMKGVAKDRQASALEGAKTVLERRVNAFGVSEPLIQTQVVNNDYRINVEMPGVNVAQAVQLIGTTAELSFWEIGSATASANEQAVFPVGIMQVLGPQAHKTNLTGNDLSSSSVTFDNSNGQPQVQLVFDTNGAKKFADITKRNVNKIVAIVLDNQVIEAPRVNQAILSGDAVITGTFTTDTAQQLSIALNAGSLPIPLSILEQQTVGATLGNEALAKSLFAGLLGFGIVVIFMVVLYGRLGILASIALVVYTLLVLALFKAIPVTLTLAGIAGFILSIGMAVDANILIFERMREELMSGKPDAVAIELGFERAWTSIRDSNASTLITSAILYKFGTGIVKGFAFTLAIGVLVSMFSAIVVTRTLIRVFYRH